MNAMNKNQVAMLEQCITPMLSNFTTQQTLISLDQFILKLKRKCALFGVCCEGVPRQVNYLIEENVCTGKGANASLLRSSFLYSTWSG